MQRHCNVWVVLALCTGCAQTLRPDNPPSTNDRGAADIPEMTDGDAAMDGVMIDATSSERWVYFDLETGLEVDPEEPEDSVAWDLAFQRYEIRVNGGTSGSQDVAVTWLEDVDFEDVTMAPSDGYVSDVEQDGDDEGQLPDYAFLLDGGWFAYNPMDHTLSPKDFVYVVRTVEDNFMKLEFLGYYDSTGESGFVSFRYDEVAAPDGWVSATDSGVPLDAGVPLDTATDAAAAMDAEVP